MKPPLACSAPSRNPWPIPRDPSWPEPWHPRACLHPLTCTHPGLNPGTLPAVSQGHISTMVTVAIRDMGVAPTPCCPTCPSTLGKPPPHCLTWLSRRTRYPTVCPTRCPSRPAMRRAADLAATRRGSRTWQGGSSKGGVGPEATTLKNRQAVAGRRVCSKRGWQAWMAGGPGGKEGHVAGDPGEEGGGGQANRMSPSRRLAGRLPSHHTPTHAHAPVSCCSPPAGIEGHASAEPKAP